VCPEVREETAGHVRVEDQTRGKLNEQAPELIPKAGRFREEGFEKLARLLKPKAMGDRLGNFHREAEGFWNTGAPAGIRRRPMGTMKGAVDLHRLEPGRIALQVAPRVRELRLLGARQAPACAADQEARRG
jgi:hypothetical protein